MSATAMEVKVRDIIGDGSLPKSRKVDRLRELQAEARSLQRAATESPMDADDGLQDDLRVVEKALLDLGVDIEEKGAATL